LPGRLLFEAEVNLISDPGYRSLSEAGESFVSEVGFDERLVQFVVTTQIVSRSVA
jgi:hypothetical protein